MIPDKMKYDLVCSLGANCSVAHQLRKRFMRSVSLPFDWLLINDSQTVAYLADAFRNRFADFMLMDNLVELKPGDPLYVEVPNSSHVPYYDKRSGYRFLHLFDGVIEASPRYYQDAYAVMRRRIDRLYQLLSRGDALLILATEVKIRDDHLMALYESLSEVFPQTHISIRLMQFASESSQEGDAPVQICNNVERFDYARKMNYYDFFQTNWEWHFLDDVQVPYSVKKAHRLQYKIWKYLGKKLA